MVYVSYLYITEQEQNRAILEYNINHDQLTGLYNRRYFYSAIETITRSTGEFSLAMVDLDNFKKINDTYGHEFGDAVLKDLSDILMSSMGESDIAVRWGGDDLQKYEQVINTADQMLYYGKNNGKNRIIKEMP